MWLWEASLAHRAEAKSSLDTITGEKSGGGARAAEMGEKGDNIFYGIWLM